MTDTDALLNGFRKFRENLYGKNPKQYRDLLSKGQSPHFAVVACADSRVDPAIAFQTEPGDIFAIRNTAALVPPYEDDGRHHGTSAALEYAVRILKVGHIIIIGHAHCGGITNMIHKQEGTESTDTFISTWTDLLKQARERALKAEPGLEGEALQTASERQAVLVSLDNLKAFPFVIDAVAAGTLSLHGWYLNIFEAMLEAFNPETGTFELLG